VPGVRIAPELNGRFPSVILRIADLKASKLILSMSEALYKSGFDSIHAFLSVVDISDLWVSLSFFFYAGTGCMES